MKNAVKSALDNAFECLGEYAEYASLHKPSIPIRVIMQRPDVTASVFGHTTVCSSTSFDVRVSDVPTPLEGDTITVDGATYVVQGAPRRDAKRLVWTIEAIEE